MFSLFLIKMHLSLNVFDYLYALERYFYTAVSSATKISFLGGTELKAVLLYYVILVSTEFHLSHYHLSQRVRDPFGIPWLIFVFTVLNNSTLLSPHYFLHFPVDF